ncbi:MAG: alpha/beta fold hydrolase [Nitrososphaeria archaeon]|nr:alpha/beta hydrolase [Conexivisphaerales archaeon]
MKENYAEIEGAKIRYLEEGEGRPVIMLHGASFTADVWAKTGTIEAVSSAGWKALALDMPGFGKSEKGNFSSISSFLSAFVDQLKLEKFVMMGASLGGKEALEYSTAHSEKILGLILVGAVGVWLYEERLPKLKDKPTLLIWGSEDAISPKENYETLLKYLKKAKLEIIGKIHPCYLEEPEKFNSAVVSFLNSI